MGSGRSARGVRSGSASREGWAEIEAELLFPDVVLAVEVNVQGIGVCTRWQGFGLYV